MTLQELINSVLADGTVSAQEGQDVMSRALMLGASAEDLSAMSGISVDEINSFIAANNLQGNLAPAGSEYDLYTPPVAAPSPINPPTVNTPPPVTPQTTSLPPIENLGNTFQGNFGNNPGGLGFQDLDPIVGGADSVQRTAIPELLKPFIAQGVDSSQGALTSLTQLLARDNALTSPFNSLQNQSQQMALDYALDPNGYLAQSQGALSEIADSTDIVNMFNEGRDLLKNPLGLQGLQNFSAFDAFNPTAQNTLEQTAAGNFLYGNPGFDAAVNASIAQASPYIKSQFALQGGSGGLSGGLSDAAIAEATANVFAREFGNERNRQIGAANSLNNFGLAANQQNLGALGSLVGAQQNAGNSMVNAANQDRSRQLAALGMLPQYGLLNSDIVGQVGGARQAQEERTKLGQIQAMQSLLSNSFGQINPNSLFGNINSVQQSSNPLLGAIGGALGGNEVGSIFGAAGGPWGAAIGGLLGALG